MKSEMTIMKNNLSDSVTLNLDNKNDKNKYVEVKTKLSKYEPIKSKAKGGDCDPLFSNQMNTINIWK